MTEPERTAFEDHFFACIGCFRRVQALEDARRVLVENVFHLTDKEAGVSARGVPPQWLAAAAALNIVVGLSLMVQAAREHSTPGREVKFVFQIKGE